MHPSHLRTLRLAFILASIASGALLLGRLIRYSNWSSWPHEAARFVSSKTQASSRSGGAFGCERHYELTLDGETFRASVDGPCGVILGPTTPEAGASTRRSSREASPAATLHRPSCS